MRDDSMVADEDEATEDMEVRLDDLNEQIDELTTMRRLAKQAAGLTPDGRRWLLAQLRRLVGE